MVDFAAEPATPSRRGSRGLPFLLLLVLGAVVLAVAMDLVLDLVHSHNLGPVHFLVEIWLVAASGGGVLFLWPRVRRSDREARALEREFQRLAARARTDREAADRAVSEYQDLFRGLQATVMDELGRWGLTEAEQEVAILLLKGNPHRDVARARGTSERTVREQAQAVYRKSGLGGRTELAAHFLNDVLPEGDADAPRRDLTSG